MTGLVIFFIVVFLVALGFAWLADQEGSLLIFRIGEFEFAQENLAVIAAILFVIALAIIFLWILFATVWNSPGRMGSFFKGRAREKGWKAVAEGVISVGAGDVSAAKRAVKNSTKYLPEEPVTKLLEAQTAQMEGKSDKARDAFEQMLEKPETEVVGLRGLYMEAERAGETEAARHFVEKAVVARPGLEWSGTALLEMQAANGDWEGALVTLTKSADSKLYDKKKAKRLRAVLLTARAMQEETANPQKAKEYALEAHRLAPDLVPAATTASRILSRLGDLRRSSKIVETSWKLEPHPELVETYVNVRAGDSGLDRLKRAQKLNSIRAHHPEGIMGLARIYIDLQDWDGARKALTGIAGVGASERVCLLMSEVEEGQYGDRGRMREWLSRAVRAPRDPVWTADGYIAERWAPFSPISGELDAFEWRVPVEELEAPSNTAIDEIPSGPADLPVIAGGSATTGAALVVPEPDNITYRRAEEEVKPEEPVEDVEVEEETPAVETKPVTAATPTDPMPTDILVPAPANDESATAEIVKDDEPLPKKDNDLGEENSVTPEDTFGEADAEMSEQVKPVDPIDRGPLDDPGTSDEASPPKKKFRLF